MKLKLLAPAFLITTILILGGVYFFQNTNILPPSKIIQATIDAQNNINKERPEDRVYASLDKPFYAPGETIWFSAFIRNATDLVPSSKSEIVRVELINPKGEIEMQYKVPTNKTGIAKGDFKLPNDLPGGQYTFQAYTLWQTNDENPKIFSKKIQIQKVILPKLKMDFDFVQEAFAPGDKVNASLKLESNENKALANQSFNYTIKIKGTTHRTFSEKTDLVGTADISFLLPKNVDSRDVTVNVSLNYKGSRESIARSVPVLLSDVDLQFYPEGGDLVTGLTSKIAYKAIDKTGHAVDVQGIVRNSKGKKITDFASLHKGIGSFDLKPNKHERYTAEITFPSHVAGTYKLPKAASQGYTLSILDVTKDHVELSIGSTDADEISIIASVRGKSHFSSGLKIKRGQNKLSIPLEDFPIGVAQITLFDKNGIARAERMAYVNADKQLSIDIETDKKNYNPREKVEMAISVKDDKGNPVQTDLALAVVDDQLLSYAADKSSNLMSWMLLEADIDIDVDEPQYYFDDREMDASLAMDQLLMTAGWRRFDWKAMAANDLPKLQARGEKMVIAGTVLDHNGTPIHKAKIKILDKSRPVASAEDGYFEIEGIDILSNPVTVAISAPGHYRQEQLVGDYGNFEYQLFDRGMGKGMEINERVNRAAQAQQLGLNNDLTPINIPQGKHISSIFTQNQMQVVNFGKRWNDVNATEASTFKPDDFEEGIQYDVKDNRLRNKVAVDGNVATGETVEGAYLSDVAFYRVREFPVKQYKSTKIDKRSDFRSTAYWNGHVQTDENGKAKISFWNTDAVTSFNITAEGMSMDGRIGRAEKQYFTQMPFSISAKIPVEVTVGDEFQIPVTLTNNTKETVSGKLNIQHPENLEAVNNINGSVSLKAGESKVLQMKYKVKKDAVEGDLGELVIGFKNPLFNDKIQEDITVVPRGFPTRVAYSGTGMETSYEVEIRDLEEYTLDVELQAFPSALSEIVQGMDGMMKKPYGCFEQSSSCNYPNILALQYLRETDQSNASVEKKANDLLKFGYDRIKGFESPNGGFEWFGGPVAHEGITAFAIMQFTHMKAVYRGVDQNIIDRSVAFLQSRKDSKGGFLRDERTTWSLGLNADEGVFNTFIVYCLSEAKVKGFDFELSHAYDVASKSDNAYVVGMAALAHHNYGLTKKANELTERQEQLVGTGSAIVSTDNQTMFGSSGINFEREAKSLLILNLAKQKNKNVELIKQLTKDIRGSREWNASFGPTHTTVLAMRALLAYSDVARETQEDGMIAFYVGDKKVATRGYAKGENETIVMDGLERFFEEGNFDFRVVFEETKYPIPHTVVFKWNTMKPVSSEDMPIALNTNIRDKNIRVGDQVRMDVKIENISLRNQPTPMAIVGIPAGLSPQVRQLNELVEAEKVAYYEISGNNVILYFRHIKKNETKDIPFDLKAEIAGDFTAAASSAYAYYNDDAKHWIAGTQVSIAN